MLSKRCRECGKEVDFIYGFGPGKICPHCGKETAKIDIKELHVNFSHTKWGNPRDIPRTDGTEYRVGIDYQSLTLVYELSVGNILRAPTSNAFVYAHKGTSYKIEKKKLERGLKLLSEIKDNVTVYLWLNDLDVNGYLNLLKFSYLFKRFNEVYVIRCNTREDYENDEYTDNDSFEKRVRISKEELDAMSERYTEIAKQGGTYRIGCYGEVKICSEEYLEAFVMSKITNRYEGFNSLYSKIRDSFEKTMEYVLLYDQVKEIFWRLMIKKQIKSHGACMWWGDSSHNNILFTQSFCRMSGITAPESEYTYDDAIETVCDAFEYGYTLPLYDILADDAVMVFEDSGRKYRGKDKIVNYIEVDGAHRVHCKEAAPNCVRLIHKEGIEIYVLIEYEWENRKGEYLVASIQFENNRIQKIQIFQPWSPFWGKRENFEKFLRGEGII